MAVAKDIMVGMDITVATGQVAGRGGGGALQQCLITGALGVTPTTVIRTLRFPSRTIRFPDVW